MGVTDEWIVTAERSTVHDFHRGDGHHAGCLHVVRVHTDDDTGKRKASVRCLSVCLSVCPPRDRSATGRQEAERRPG